VDASDKDADRAGRSKVFRGFAYAIAAAVSFAYFHHQGRDMFAAVIAAVWCLLGIFVFIPPMRRK
jgi:hypothetical protein